MSLPLLSMILTSVIFTGTTVFGLRNVKYFVLPETLDETYCSVGVSVSMV